MSRYLRPRLPGTAIFFTVTLAGRGGSLLVDHVGLLRAAVAQTRAERPFGIEAWVVLPDHLHCIWTLPQGDADYSTRWRLIKTRLSRAGPVGARRASHIRRQERGIWQRRFWEHHIRDEADMAAHLRYFWWNPVKHGFAARPEDWPYLGITGISSDLRVRAYTHNWTVRWEWCVRVRTLRLFQVPVPA